MKINQIIINEMTTAGAVATVAKPMGETQKRPEVAGLKPVDKIAKAKKKGPYANSLVEGAMKDFDIQRQDYQRMTPQQFFAAYKMTKQEWLAKNKQLLQQKPVAESKKLADKLTAKLKKNVEQHNKKKKETDEKVKQHQKDKVDEAELQEDDLVIIPGQGIKRKTGFVQKGQSRVDHEVEMARSDVLATMKNAKAIYKLLQDRSEDEGIEGWVQEKLIKANDYLNAVKEYYDEKMMQEMTGGVIAGGGVGEGVAEGFPQPGETSGKAKQFNPNAKIQTKEMTLDQILNTVKGIPYVNEVIQDWDAKDYSWGVTKKVIEYAQYLQKNPQSVANLPPLVVIDGQLNDGAHRLSAINLLQKRMDPKNPLWKQVKLKVNFGTSADVMSEQGVAEGQAPTYNVIDVKTGKSVGTFRDGAGFMPGANAKAMGLKPSPTVPNGYKVDYKSIVSEQGVAGNQQPVRPTNPPQPVKKKPMTPFGPGQQKVNEKFASQQQAKLMYATAGGADTGVSKKVAKEFIKKSHGQKVKDLPKKVKKG